jgi:putative FmdB family regulatory protein
MPIYEYTCPQCNGRFQKLVQGFGTPSNLQCPRCGNRNVQKAVARFAFMQGEEARLEALADPTSLAGLDENDPVAVARWAKKMGKELGEDVGDDWDEMVEEMLEEELQGKPGGAQSGTDDLGWG